MGLRVTLAEIVNVVRKNDALVLVLGLMVVFLPFYTLISLDEGNWFKWMLEGFANG
jgi:hypothetical protein